MSTIKSPQELTQRLQTILRQASTGTPTRARLAEDLKQVAEDLEEDAQCQQKTASDEEEIAKDKAARITGLFDAIEKGGGRPETGSGIPLQADG